MLLDSQIHLLSLSEAGVLIKEVPMWILTVSLRDLHFI